MDKETQPHCRELQSQHRDDLSTESPRTRRPLLEQSEDVLADRVSVLAEGDYIALIFVFFAALTWCRVKEEEVRETVHMDGDRLVHSVSRRKRRGREGNLWSEELAVIVGGEDSQGDPLYEWYLCQPVIRSVSRLRDSRHAAPVLGTDLALGAFILVLIVERVTGSGEDVLVRVVLPDDVEVDLESITGSEEKGEEGDTYDGQDLAVEIIGPDRQGSGDLRHERLEPEVGLRELQWTNAYLLGGEDAVVIFTEELLLDHGVDPPHDWLGLQTTVPRLVPPVLRREGGLVLLLVTGAK
jgi:hypothetical protein